ncbi:lysophospholipase [Intrasporangium oryzae NRRL B-24470]|uniref:Lysophospholipase n=1 Tax=Intrasporangium oryzae NRRL B-24470 TaxID=1386089 RepID=W9GDK3_9MICO|nr:alpha/beta hydrolase [Intrasporangium oryzae]EWT03297.1 lysophospholipase [Intrasporangium oryzae NRRL B-24470]
MDETDLQFEGHEGTIVGRRWQRDTDGADGPSGGDPTYIALIVHGYGEHCGRYAHVARRLVDDGAVVYAVDHVGHGRSEGERALIDDIETVCEDVHLLEGLARGEHPTLPLVLIGHSMGGLIAARYAQRWGDGLACIVLSGPVIGTWAPLDGLLAADVIPDVPIDPAVLSRDPAVGQAYLDDELVWHGSFKRATLESLRHAMGNVRASGPVDDPLLWIHGEEDRLVPIAGSRIGWRDLKGRHSSAKSYPGARHEIFNETNQDEVIGDVVAFIHEHVPQPVA